MNHFITVSKRGELVARRKGKPPATVATAAAGLRVTLGELTLQIHFAHGGGNRQMLVTTVEVANETHPVAEFQSRYQVADEALGQAIREAVERALDLA